MRHAESPELTRGREPRHDSGSRELHTVVRNPRDRKRSSGLLANRQLDVYAVHGRRRGRQMAVLDADAERRTTSPDFGRLRGAKTVAATPRCAGEGALTNRMREASTERVQGCKASRWLGTTVGPNE